EPSMPSASRRSHRPPPMRRSGLSTAARSSRSAVSAQSFDTTTEIGTLRPVGSGNTDPTRRRKGEKMATIVGFNYSAIDDPKTRKLARDHARAIRVQLEKTARAIVDIGRRLIEVHDTVGRENFQAWLKAEFRWSQ